MKCGFGGVGLGSSWVGVPGRLGQEDFACGFSPVDTIGLTGVHVPFLIGTCGPAGVHLLGVITYVAGAAGPYLMMDLKGLRVHVRDPGPGRNAVKPSLILVLCWAFVEGSAW